MTKRAIGKLFGNRVALQMVEEEYKGLIVPAPTQQKMHVLSKVVAVGEKVPSDIKMHDILFWQTNALIESHCRYQLNGSPVFVLGTGDMIARLTEREVTLKNFNVIGDWLLIKKVVIEPSKLIILPDEVKDNNQDITVQFILEQKGNTVEMDIAPGDDLIVDRTRANPIKLGDDHYFYLHKNFVLGKMN